MIFFAGSRIGCLFAFSMSQGDESGNQTGV